MKKSIILGIAVSMMFGLCAHAEDVYTYQSNGKRDPLIPLVGVNISAISSLDDIVNIEDVVLQGVATGAGGEKIAILNGEMVKVGQSGGRVTVKSISKDKVTITIDDEDYTLVMQEENKK
ncbi:MAG: hypothetical protein ABIH57_00555 [Candidatus Omnitrophota bacterium]